MSDTIPPLYSSSPPPLTKSNFADDGDSEEDEDDDDDEYGKFEEYSAVYDHTVEEILNNSPRKPIKSESKATLSSSESITGKNITDSPNNLHCTTDLNLSSVPLSSDILHSKSSDRSITSKVLENNSINIENTFSDSAINILGTDDVLIVHRDSLSRDNSTSKAFSEPVTIGNSINCTESVSEKILRKNKNTCDSSGCNDINIYAGLELTKAAEKIINSKVNSVGVSSIPIVNNCSNLTSTVSGGSLNDDDFEFDDFQSFSEQTPSTLYFVTDINGIEKSDLTQKFNAFTTKESFSHKNDMPNIEAAIAQSEVNHEHASNDTLSCVPKNLNETDDLSMFKKLEINGSLPIVEANSAVQKNSNDLSNAFNLFNNTRNSGSVTTVESNFSPASSVINATALESNQITEDIMKAGKKGAECAESNSEGTPLDLVNKIILVSQTLESNEDDCFGDFEFANAPQGSTIESLNHVSNSQSQVELLSDDDFCDFESANTLTAEQAVNEESLAVNEIEVKQKECPAFETDFTSFASHSLVDDSNGFSDCKSTNVDLKISPNDSKTAESFADLEGNFGDFKTSFSETPADIAIASSSKFDVAKGEFDDFSDFSTYEQSSVPKLDGAEPAGHEGDKFWINLFPLCEEGVREIDVVSISDLVVASRIWTKLRDVESSQALAFEWSKSTSYNKYLSSLKIDVRNVFGVQWRSNVPRFAANLGCAPLEPSKAAKDLNPAKPVSGQSTELLQSNHPDLVPAAHFDWISSGLVNPLDGTKKKGIPAVEPPKQKSKDEAIDAEVQEFLQSLPDLSFMLVSHIQFPMNPTNTDKSS